MAYPCGGATVHLTFGPALPSYLHPYRFELKLEMGRQEARSVAGRLKGFPLPCRVHRGATGVPMT